MAHYALHTRLHVRPVRPGHAGSDLVDALPRNRLASAPELGKFCDRGFVFGDGAVARHADSGGRENAMNFIIGSELYDHLERVVDRFEDVSNEINSIVIDQL